MEIAAVLLRILASLGGLAEDNRAELERAIADFAEEHSALVRHFLVKVPAAPAPAEPEPVPEPEPEPVPEPAPPVATEWQPAHAAPEAPAPAV